MQAAKVKITHFIRGSSWLPGPAQLWPAVQDSVKNPCLVAWGCKDDPLYSIQSPKSAGSRYMPCRAWLVAGRAPVHPCVFPLRAHRDIHARRQGLQQEVGARDPRVGVISSSNEASQIRLHLKNNKAHTCPTHTCPCELDDDSSK